MGHPSSSNNIIIGLCQAIHISSTRNKWIVNQSQFIQKLVIIICKQVFVVSGSKRCLIIKSRIVSTVNEHFTFTECRAYVSETIPKCTYYLTFFVD
jgi:hypothetical protein